MSKRDTRNNYALFWNGRYCCEVRGYRQALLERHELALNFARQCPSRGKFPVYLLDTTACTECASCSQYCRAIMSKEICR